MFAIRPEMLRLQVFLAVISAILLTPRLHSAQLQDSLTVAAPDTTATDSVRVVMIRGIGNIFPEGDTTALFYSSFLWTDARTLGDLFRFTPGMFLRELGTPGKPDQLTLHGLDARGLTFLMDGKPLRNPVTGAVNIAEIPVEFVDHIEVKTYEESFVAGESGSAALMNIVSRQYNTGRPITKIRFMQGPYEHLLTDAMFTQNIIQGLNIFAGLQRHVSDDRFTNSSYDAWSVRTRLRYNVSGSLNISLTDFYRTSVSGMNNGIDIDSTHRRGLDEFNEAEAAVFSRSASDERTQRDFTLSAIALLFPDSAWRTTARAYLTTANRQYSPSGLTPGSFDRYAFEIQGVAVNQVLRFGSVRGRFGGHLERRIAGLGPLGVRDFTASAWNADMGIDVHPFRPSVFARGERVRSVSGFSWGARTEASPVKSVNLTAGFSQFYRFPTLQELNWAMYRFQAPPNLVESHRKIHLGAELRTAAADLSIHTSHQTVKNALLFKVVSPVAKLPDVLLDVVPEMTIAQISGSLLLRFWGLEATGGMTWTEVREGSAVSSAHPRIILTGELAYRDVLLNGALEARFALQSRFVGRHTPARFFPGGELYAESTGKSVKAFSTIDLYGVFNVGDAFVNITWENPLDRQFMTVYPYPAMGRNIKVGINWIFLD
ncbi:MAG: TonB-dependent receptor plug domain-containing protein [Bacteroidota bacterium]